MLKSPAMQQHARINTIFRIVASSLIVAWGVGLAAQSGEVDITREPHHHLIFENTLVRVFDVKVPPSETTLIHRHNHDYVYVTLGAADLDNRVEGKPPARVQLHDAETRFLAGNFAHAVRDLASTPFRNITIELLQDATTGNPSSPWDSGKNEDRSLQILNRGTQQVLFVKDAARVSEIELQPGGAIPCHHHNGPHLVVAVTDVDVRSDVEGKGTATLHLNVGETKWVDGGFTHTLTNVGKQTAKFVTIEFP
jgi:quercetin dioxygenase-like cupin family protein